MGRPGGRGGGEGRGREGLNQAFKIEGDKERSWVCIYRLKVLGTLGMVELPPVVRETDLAGEREDMSDVNLSVVEQAHLRKVGIYIMISVLSPLPLPLTQPNSPRNYMYTYMYMYIDFSYLSARSLPSPPLHLHV